MPSQITPEQFRDWELEVRLGNISGYAAKSVLGHTDAMDTNLRYLHHQHADGDLDLTGLYDTPATVKVSSSSTNDEGAPTGQGADTVLLTGYDSSGNVQSETIDMTGQTEVVSSNTYKFVESAVVTAVGTVGSNAGVIWVGAGTVTSGVPATKYLSIEIGTNISRNGSMFVPNGTTFYPEQLIVNLSDTGKNVTVRIVSYNGSILYEVFDLHFTGTTFFRVPIISFAGITQSTLVGLQVLVGVAGGDITTAMGGTLVDN